MFLLIIFNMVFSNIYSCYEADDINVHFRSFNSTFTQDTCNLEIEAGHVVLATIESSRTYYIKLYEKKYDGTYDNNNVEFLPRRLNKNKETDFLIYTGLYQDNDRVVIIFDGKTGKEIAKYNIKIIHNKTNAVNINQTTTSLNIRRKERKLFRSFESSDYIYEALYYNREYWDFVYPLEYIQGKQYKITAKFAEKRNYSNVDNVYHEGLDLVIYDSGKIPDIVAPAKGKIIALIKNLALHGNVVIIDHGEGIISVLAHLAYFDNSIELGDLVEQGQVLGSMGNSGATTSYHVHWTVMINGTFIDPLDIFNL